MSEATPMTQVREAVARKIVRDWLDEIEGFGVRSERLLELINPHRFAAIEPWLVAACEQGLAALSTPQVTGEAEDRRGSWREHQCSDCGSTDIRGPFCAPCNPELFAPAQPIQPEQWKALEEIDHLCLIILSCVNFGDKDNLARVSDALKAARQALTSKPPASPPLHDLTDEDLQRASIDWSIATVDMGLSDDPLETMKHVLTKFIQHRRAGGNPNPASKS